MIEPSQDRKNSPRVPLIGVTTAWADRAKAASLTRNGDLVYCETSYCRCVERAGGIPALIPVVRDGSFPGRLTERLDGLLLTGGEDVHPRRYGQDILFDSCVISEARDEFEFRLAAEFLATGKPMFAICRGCQLVNVLLGGTLMQDVSNQAGICHHAQTTAADQPSHRVELREGSRLATCFSKTMIEVNSTHHQAVERLGEALRLTGWSEEGVVEALEHRTHPFLVGVQWHPERLAEKSNGHQRLFDHFVMAAAQAKESHE